MDDVVYASSTRSRTRSLLRHCPSLTAPLLQMPPAPRAGGGSGKAPPPPQQSAATLAFINAEVAKQLEEALSEVKKVRECFRQLLDS